MGEVSGDGRRSSGDNRFHSRCMDSFRASRLWWHLEQTLDSKLDHKLWSVGVRSEDYDGHSADMMKPWKLALQHVCVLFILGARG